MAKALDDTRMITGIGAIGTPRTWLRRYVSDARDPRLRSVFAGLLIAYELLTGHAPFDGDAVGVEHA